MAVEMTLQPNFFLSAMLYEHIGKNVNLILLLFLMDDLHNADLVYANFEKKNTNSTNCFAKLFHIHAYLKTHCKKY